LAPQASLQTLTKRKPKKSSKLYHSFCPAVVKDLRYVTVLPFLPSMLSSLFVGEWGDYGSGRVVVEE